jgi:hypothetical protein
MEEKLHRRWVKIGGKKGSIFDGNFQVISFHERILILANLFTQPISLKFAYSEHVICN